MHMIGFLTMIRLSRLQFPRHHELSRSYSRELLQAATVQSPATLRALIIKMMSQRALQLSMRPGRCDVEITSPWRCVGLRSRSRLHWSSTGPLRRLREVDIAPRMPDKAGSSRRSAMRPILNATTVKHFPHWLPRALMPTAVKLPFRQ